MEYVLVSACLLGEKVRHNGADKRSDSDVLLRWIREGRVVSVCPEVAGGLPVPRRPAEIVGGAGGEAVIAGFSTVLDDLGVDVTSHFVRGADRALEIALARGIRLAILKEGSPSCGTSFVYDGTFTGSRQAEMGVTAARLRAAGVRVFSEAGLDDADRFLASIEHRANDGP